jgi:hypothetical protein
MPAIKKPSDHFNVATWTANVANPTAGGKSIAVGFQPDLVWSKNRNDAEAHYWVDSVRGDNSGSKWLRSNSTAAEGADAVGSSTAKYVFTSTGFDIIDTDSNAGEVYYSTASRTYVGWNWKAGGAAVTNTTGTISAQVSANPTAGFSVVTGTFPSTGTSCTFGHGLGVAPSMIISKGRDGGTSNWIVRHTSLANMTTKYLEMNNNGAVGTGSNAATAPSSTIASVSTDGLNNNMAFVAYCFAAVAGYSAFGSYTVNNSADGPFIYTGFRPRWILIRNTGASGWNWTIIDTSRNTYNVTNASLYPDLSNAEGTANNIADILSNGFKIRSSWET